MSVSVGELLLKLAKMAINVRTPTNRPFTVTVEGNIGSGKTTFLEYFKKYENVCVLAEPIEMWRNCNGHNLLVSFSYKLTYGVYGSNYC